MMSSRGVESGDTHPNPLYCPLSYFLRCECRCKSTGTWYPSWSWVRSIIPNVSILVRHYVELTLWTTLPELPTSK